MMGAHPGRHKLAVAHRISLHIDLVHVEHGVNHGQVYILADAGSFPVV